MYAIIEDSGTQIKVVPGKEYDIDRRNLPNDQSEVVFDRVLMVGDAENGGEATVGTPYVDGATVKADVLGERKGEKLDVIKFKRRKGYRVKQGHRQQYLRVRVSSIDA